MSTTMSIRSLSLSLLASLSVYSPLHALTSPDDKSTPPPSPEDLKLVQVQIITRHGARSPISKLALDPNNKYRVDWDVCQPNSLSKVIQLQPKIYGFGQMRENGILEEGRDAGYCRKGQLSVVGAKQMYDLGKRLRRRYIEEGRLLKEELNKGEVKVRSTYKERTVNSALALMSGLYPEGTRGGLKEVEVFIGRDNEEILFPNSKFCHRLKNRFDEFSTVRSFGKDEENNGIRRAIGEYDPELFGKRNGGKEDDREVDLGPFNLRDLFAAVDAHEKELPTVLTRELRNRIDNYTTNYFRKRLLRRNSENDSGSKDDNSGSNGGDDLDEEVLKLASGPLLREVLSHAENNREQKLLVYSGHDATLIPLLAVLDYNLTDTWPPFAANVIFETYEQHGEKKADKNELYIRVLYNGVPIRLNGCPGNGQPCKLEAFKKEFDKFVSRDRNEECKMEGVTEQLQAAVDDKLIA